MTCSAGVEYLRAMQVPKHCDALLLRTGRGVGAVGSALLA